MVQQKGNIFDQIRGFFRRLTLGQKVFLVVAVLLSAAAVWLVVNIAGAVGYGVLYSNLSLKDSGLIVEKIKERKIPYKLESGGSVIRVPSDKVAELRIGLATEGLPEGGGVGFELFDKTSFSTTDFVQNVNYVRALEGELARSIAQIKEVASARVHITPARTSVFIEDQAVAKASIVLKLKPGAILSASIVPAIIHLTAQSVEGLTPENIAVIDVYGRLLSRPRQQADSFEQSASTQMSYQKSLEDDFAKKVIDLLEPIVGPGKVRADVRLNLDFNKVETNEQTVDPETTAKVSEQTESSTSTGGAAGGGVPGVASNVAGAATNVQASAANQAKSKSEKSIVNYEFSKRVTHQVKPVGEIRSLSAAVVVDDDVEMRNEGGKITRNVRPRTAEELDKLKKLVQAAVGYNLTRGDLVEVTNLSFDTSAEVESEYYAKERKTSELVDNIIRYGAIAIAAVLLFLFVLRPLLRKLGEIFRSGGLALPKSFDIPRLETEKIAEMQKLKDEVEIEKELLEKYKVPKEVKKMTILRERAQDFAKENPDNAAALIRSFLAEGK